jgi:hypothetical protein
MILISLDNYAPIISSKSVGTEVYIELKSYLDKGDSIEVDLSSIKTMATFCAKQIFGKIYVELGSEQFFNRVNLKGADEDLKMIIQIGIQHALEEGLDD